MPAPLLERRLKMVSRRLSQLRADLSLADEQLAHFVEESDDARIRALVSETPLSEHEHREAERSTTAMARHRDDLVDRIARLEAEQDALLDKLSSRRRS
jgi:hypothetical protein